MFPHSAQRQELRNRLAILLAHLLKWQFQPDRLIADSPSLRADLEDAIAHAHARDLAIAETDLPETTLPATCPYAIATLRDPDVYLAPTDPESRSGIKAISGWVRAGREREAK